MKTEGKSKYTFAIKELHMMKSLFVSKSTEKTAFYYNSEDLPNHVQVDPGLLEEWIEVLNKDGVIIHDQIHGVH